MPPLAGELRSLAEKMCREEWKGYLIYSFLAGLEKDPEKRKVLSALAAQERRHYEFWRKLLGDCKTSGVNLLAYRIGYYLLGGAFVLRMLERGERETTRIYQELAEKLPEHREDILRIAREEAEHEEKLRAIYRDVRVEYLGYVALGLADAIVEVTGVNAGFLGATESPVLAGLAGLMVGFSASISMASAAYLQAKHEGGSVKPGMSALVTGLSYMLSVLLLVAPFFTLPSIHAAFAASLVVAALLAASLSYYTSVIHDRSTLAEIAENLGILFATAFASYLFGRLVSTLIPVQLPVG